MASQIDTSRLSLGALVTGAGGVLLLLGTFIAWGGEMNAWDVFGFVDLLLVLVALIAIGTAAVQLMPTPPELPVRPADAALWGGLFAFGVSLSFLDAAEDSKFGLILTFLSSLAIIAGAVLAQREPVTGFGRRPGGGAGAGGSLGAGPGEGAAGPAGTGTPASTQVGQPAATGAAAATGSPAPDWYPDPKGEARLRYWDGSAWTDQTAD